MKYNFILSVAAYINYNYNISKIAYAINKLQKTTLLLN